MLNPIKCNYSKKTARTYTVFLNEKIEKTITKYAKRGHLIQLHIFKNDYELISNILINYNQNSITNWDYYYNSKSISHRTINTYCQETIGSAIEDILELNRGSKCLWKKLT